jgi:hypothetical protein
MKKLINLKGAQVLNTTEQKGVNAGRMPGCSMGCAGKSAGDACYASPNCGCPGCCSTSQGCIPY